MVSGRVNLTPNRIPQNQNAAGHNVTWTKRPLDDASLHPMDTFQSVRRSTAPPSLAAPAHSMKVNVTNPSRTDVAARPRSIAGVTICHWMKLHAVGRCGRCSRCGVSCACCLCNGSVTAHDDTFVCPSFCLPQADSDVVSVSTSPSRDGFETHQRLVSVSSRQKNTTSRLCFSYLRFMPNTLFCQN